MQTAHRTSHLKRVREISFSSLQNYSPRNESRNESPSIALESILQLNSSIQEGEECLHAIRKRYTLRDGCSQQPSKREKYMDIKENIGSKCLNILPSKSFNSNKQTKQQNLKQKIARMPITPLKDKTNETDNQPINTSAYYSNMSPVKDQQTNAPCIKIKDKSSNSYLNYTNQDHNYEVISSTSYEYLRETYTNPNKRTQSQYSDHLIQGELCKLRKQIEKLQNIKKNRIIEQEHQKTSQYCLTDRQTTLKLMTDRMNVKSNYTQKQGETLSLSASKSTDSLAKSHIFIIKQRINEEDVKTPKLLSKIFGKVNKSIKQKNSSHQTTQISNMQPKAVPYQKVKGQKMEVAPPKYSQNLLQCLQQQIKIDDNFRKSKKWFKKSASNRKWQDLRSILQKQNVKLSQTQQRNIFNLISQEQNPFYMPKQSDYSIGRLVLNYMAAQNHWNSFISKRHSAKLLQQGTFKEENLDISKRGEIRIEDLVRYINFQLDTCYRNRDIFLIFNRFSKGGKLYFAGLLQCLHNESL